MTKSTSYRETIRRYRWLLAAPIVLAGLIATYLVMSTTPAYQANTSLWVDNPASTGSSLGNLTPGVSPPSTQEQQVVTELLSTDNVKLAVARESSLRRYLTTQSSGNGSVRAQILAALGGGHVLTKAPGPQVLQISYAGPTPAVAASVVKALVYEIQRSSLALGEQHYARAVAYGKSQVQAATQALDAARGAADAYLRQHPGTPLNNPNLTALTAAEGSAGTQLTQANTTLTAAESAQRNGSGGFSVQVIDSPAGAVALGGSKKKKVEGVLAGLFAGALISFLAMVALTRGKEDPWEDELVVGNGVHERWKFMDPPPRAPESGPVFARRDSADAIADEPIRKPRLKYSIRSHAQSGVPTRQQGPEEPDQA